jgi:DNA polymerase III delta prime subunit
MAKQNANKLALLKGILNGRANHADWLEWHSLKADGAELPFQAKVEPDVLPSRISMLTSLMKWAMSAFHNFRKNTPTSMKIAVICGRGQGATYVSERLYVILKDYLAADRSLASEASVYMLTKRGTLLQAEGKPPQLIPGQQAKLLFVTDGMFSRQQMTDGLYDAMSKGVVISFVNDPTEIQSIFSEDPITIRLPDLTEEEIFRIAREKDLIPTTHQEEMCALIRRLLRRDLTPKSVLDYLAAASGLSYDKVGVAQKRIAEPYHIIESIITHNTEINVFDDLDPKQLRKTLKEEVIDQDEAVDSLADAIMVMQMGLQDKNRPSLVAMFLGSTGTGKTMLARRLSKAIFGREEIVRIDMGEYSSPVDSHKLFGASPMYVGYGEDTALVRAVKRRRRGIILFDEIEKAHDDVRNAMLQMLDYGHFTSGNGTRYDITGYIIIMTSNALADSLFAGKGIGFESGNRKITSGVIRRELENAKMFRPEFINRIDCVVGFRPISDATAEKIAINQLDQLCQDVEDRCGKTVKYDKAYLLELLSKRDPRYGGRDIYRLVQGARQYVVKLMMDDPEAEQLKLAVPVTEAEKARYTNDW